ncbi:MAG TPA: hypothetical protein VNT79_12780 [Phycisphaerae bacterium]|nr:hypothetical protein [Phycisphaerae bacterium]
MDHHGDGRIAFWCKSTAADQRQRVKDDPLAFFVPPYVGTKGWVGVRLDLKAVNWWAIVQLSRRTYQATAPKKLAALME